MAILPSKNASSGKAGAGARFRQRKISVKVSLPIYNQKDVSGPESELEPSQLHHLSAGAAQQPRDLHAIETGVDKNEEDEVHLQQVINAAQRVLMGSLKDDSKSGDTKTEAATVYIPTPDASKLWKDASKYYSDSLFVEPESYIKFSATVEDTLGVEYNMDERDEEFFKKVLLKQYPKKPAKKNDKSPPNEEDTRLCTELEFETICDKLEKTIEEKQPFLSMDPSNILTFKELSSYILAEINSNSNKDFPHLQSGRYISTTSLKENLSKELKFEPFVTLFDKNPNSLSSTTHLRSIPKLLELFGEPVYEHWKTRKIERKGKTVTPDLKFEDPNANEKDNDNDPYVCFRRREFRQARKTRRADNLGAERIRLLQKSLKRARELVLNVSKRELLKLETWKIDYEIFKLRCEAKEVKRAVGVKGDDNLFYPHKRRKIIRIIPEDDDDVIESAKTKRERRRERDLNSPLVPTKDRLLNGQLQPEASSTQPYVKLPPSKIPDMDLVTVSLVLKEKNETIKRAVLEKLRKRKEHDKGYVNITYDPYQPFFNVSTNKGNKHLELSHIPYSSIASSSYHQINTTNVISDQLKKILEEGKKPLPGMKTFRGSNGELIPSKPFPHLQTLLHDHLNSKANSSGYIAQLLSNIQTNNFNSYSNGFGKHLADDGEDMGVSEPIFRLRKRASRNGQLFVDRRGLMRRPDDEINDWLTFSDNEDAEDVEMADASPRPLGVPNAYDCKPDVIKRMDSRWRYDDDYTASDKGIRSPFSLDPSRLNCISDDTQSIRFGSMLLSKSYDLLRESAHLRQVQIQQARIRALQQHQLNNRNLLLSLQLLQGANQGGSAANRGSGISPASSGALSGAYRKTTPGNYSAAPSNKFGAGRPQPTESQKLQAMQQFRKQQQTQQQQQQQTQAYLAQKRAAGSGMSPSSMTPSPSTSSTLYNKYSAAMQERSR